MVNRAKIAGYIIITRIHHYTYTAARFNSFAQLVRTMEILIVDGEQVRLSGLTADSL